MRRGELYRVLHPAGDPKKSRVFVVVGRQVALDSQFSTAICVPVYSAYDGLSTQVKIGPNEGLKHESSIHCDEIVSLRKSALTNYVGSLPPLKMEELEAALQIALEL